MEWELEFHALENLLGIRLLVRDISGRLARVLPPDRETARRRSFHRPHADCAAGFGKRCLEHCAGTVLERAARVDAPFHHTCWKALEEIVVPVRLGGRTVAVIFAGPWQADRWPPLTDIAAWPTPWAVALSGKPRLDPTRAGELRLALQLFAEGLAHRLEQLEATDPPERRVAAIHRFIRANAAGRPSLAGLAAELGVSPSRASHLVTALCGAPFERLLRQERLAQAQRLLRLSDATVAQIANWTGFDSEPYFCRVFKRETGLTPSQYRSGGVLPPRGSGGD